VKNKKWLLLVIIVFPSFFWLILETSTINSRRLPVYGPKTAVKPGDTVFHEVADLFKGVGKEASETRILSKKEFPFYSIVFIDDKFRTDAYRLTGLWEYLTYKKNKIEHIPFFLVVKNAENGESKVYGELQKLASHPNVHFLGLPEKEFDAAVKNHFLDKPYYIDYSFFLLIDENRHVRGYYDARYVSEFKRLAEEYQHLRLKEEKQKMINENEIHTN